MAPVRRIEGVFAFDVVDGLTDQAEPLWARARAAPRRHGARASSIGSRARRCRLSSPATKPTARRRVQAGTSISPSPSMLRESDLSFLRHTFSGGAKLRKNERKASFAILDEALDDFRELRAGAAGKLALVPCAVDMQDDPLFARSRVMGKPDALPRDAACED